jgi:hypothetical protein
MIEPGRHVQADVGPSPAVRSPDPLFIVILAIALLARIASMLILNAIGFTSTGSEHWLPAHCLYEGKGFCFDWYGLYDAPMPSSFLPPLYSWVLYLALLATRGQEHAAMILGQLLNVVLGTATVYLIARLARLAAPERAAGPRPGPVPPGTPRSLRSNLRLARILRDPGLAAASVWAVYPPALGHAAQTQTQVLETFLLLSLVFLLLTGLRRIDRLPQLPVATRAILPGLVLGLFLLVRPTAAILWVAWAAVLLKVTRQRARMFTLLAVSSMVAALVIAPWTVRNWRLHGRPVPISSNGGFNFYMGNNPVGEGGIPPLALFFPRMTEEERTTWRALEEVDRDRRFYSLGLAYWRQQPGRALAGVWHRFIEFVFFRPFLFAAYPRWLYLIFVVSYGAILIPFLAALPRCRGPACSIPLLAIVITGLVSLVYVVSMRFRATVEPFLVTLSAGRLISAHHQPDSEQD